MIIAADYKTMQIISGNIAGNNQVLKNCIDIARNVFTGNSQINRTIKKVCSEMETETIIMGQMVNILNRSYDQYIKYEERIKRVSKTGEESKKNENLWDYTVTWKNGLKILGNFGAAGGLVGAAATLIFGDRNTSDYLNAGKYLSSTVGTGAVAVSKGGAEGIEYFFGLNNGFTEIDTQSFGTALKSSLVKQKNALDIRNADDWASKTNVVAKWAGHLFTFGVNGVENYDEYKTGEISAARAVGETVIESAVDIGVGIGATALATAAISAIGVAAAPAVAVGAAATVITIGANATCKWITGGRDLGEVAADFICDATESTGGFISDIGKGAVRLFENGVSAINNSLTIGWKQLCRAYA